MNPFSFSPPTDKWTNTPNEKRRALLYPPSLPPSRLTRGGWAEMEKSVRSFVRSLARCGVRVAALRRRGNLERWPTERRPRPHVRHTQHAEPRRDIIKRNVRRFSPPSRPSFRSASSSRLAPAAGACCYSGNKSCAAQTQRKMQRKSIFYGWSIKCPRSTITSSV